MTYTLIYFNEKSIFIDLFFLISINDAWIVVFFTPEYSPESIKLP